MPIDDKTLFGLSHEHLKRHDERCFIHAGLVEPLDRLLRASGDAGFNLRLASGFRAFDRQLMIWNSKFNGDRAIHDLAGNVVDTTAMDEWQRCQAILLHSALPGASRHHWGCDFDFYDAATLPPGYRLQLIEAEYLGQGPFAPLCRWLKHHAADYRFFFPYSRFNGGIASEPWHLSYVPLAKDYLSRLSADKLAKQLATVDIGGKTAILAHMDEIFARYINNVEASAEDFQ